MYTPLAFICILLLLEKQAHKFRYCHALFSLLVDHIVKFSFHFVLINFQLDNQMQHSWVFIYQQQVNQYSNKFQASIMHHHFYSKTLLGVFLPRRHSFLLQVLNFFLHKLIFVDQPLTSFVKQLLKDVFL